MTDNCFSTPEFMRFVHKANSYSFIKQSSSFPVELVTSSIRSPNRLSISFPSAITPICFSGPDCTFFPKEGASTLDSILNIPTCIDNNCTNDAGFVQTRMPLDSNQNYPLIFERNDFNVLIDSRSAYFLNYADPLDNLLDSMRKDSKQRSTRILRSRDSYEFIPSCALDESSRNKYIKDLSRVYNQLSTLKKFSAQYQFSHNDWFALFSSSLWSFHVLIYKSTGARSFAVIGETLIGHEYAFAMSEPSKADLSRAMILFSYLYLSQHNNKKLSYLNLGGGIHEDDSLADFKQSMGATRMNLARIKYSKPYITEYLGSLDHLHNYWPL